MDLPISHHNDDFCRPFAFRHGTRAPQESKRETHNWAAKVFSSFPPSADGDSPRRDFENRMTSVVLPGTGGTVTFKYDPFGRRIYKSSSAGTAIFAYDGDNRIDDLNQNVEFITKTVTLKNQNTLYATLVSSPGNKVIITIERQSSRSLNSAVRDCA